MISRTAWLAAIAAVALAVAPSAAWAHAELLSTSPAQGTTLHAQPAAVSFRFGESVSGTQGAVRVFDTHGARVDDGNAYHPGGRGAVYAVRLKPGLPHGTYTATYRVVSADTHVVTGGDVFSIGTSSARAASVGSLLAGQKTGGVTSTAFSFVRAVQYAAIGLALGLLVFLFAVWLPVLRRVAGGTRDWSDASARFAARARTGLIGVAVVGFVASLAGIALEGAQSSGVSFVHAINPTVLDGVVKQRFGMVWSVAAAAWLVIAAAAWWLLAPRRESAAVLRPVALGADGLALRSPARDPRWLALVVPALLLVSLPALAGHASIESTVWLFLPMNLIHVTAMSVWLGGLAALALLLPAATRALDGPVRTRLLSGVLSRFSPFALTAVIALLATGTVQALLQIDAWSELWNTAYGRAVLVKVGLMLVLIGLGALNRQRTLPRLRALARDDATPGQTGMVVRRTLRAELAVLAAVLVTTGALAGYAPAKTVAGGPQQLSGALGPANLSVDIDPARVGGNELHIYLFDRRTGAQYTKTKQLTVNATLPDKHIGPLVLDARHTGPGHYTIPAAVFGTAGTWRLLVSARVSDFDEYTRDFDVKIR